ncbi:unnamed protein product [Porites lobata]|uniref:Uncharacterized protein n=1 Tax=Porites lobata TaxID=104759 RepID=A0ABN8PY74_9CNID|nr:unnamed protein product [Porites lobata]
MLIAWICSQELGFVLKSEQREALELLLRGKDVFCVLPTGFDKSLIYQMFVHAKSSSSSVQRPTVIRSVGNTRLLPHANMPLVPMNCFLCRVDYGLEENVLTEQM